MSVAEAFLEETVVFVNFLLIVQLLVLLKFPLFVLPLQTTWLKFNLPFFNYFGSGKLFVTKILIFLNF